MSELVIAPVLVALVTAIVTLAIRFAPRAQRAASVTGAAAYLVVVTLLANRILGPHVRATDPAQIGNVVLTYQVSSWPAPYGITLVADALSVFFLVIAAIVGLAAAVFSARYVDPVGQRVSYHPLFHFMLVGVSGSLLTGDVFNLFVWFEVMLMPSYVLVVFYSGAEHTSAALRYTAMNLVGSAVMLLAIGGLYATTGTLNMADVAYRLAHAQRYSIDPAPVLGIAALLLAVFALKAGLVPFQFWVPSAYRAAPAPATAMLAGVTKKVGVYAIIRLFFTVFGAATLSEGLATPLFTGTSFLNYVGPVLFVMASASILFGGVGAASRADLDGVLAYSSIAQVGFIVLPLAVAATAESDALRVLGIVAALVYSLNHAIAKSALFMLTGTIRDAIGSLRFADLGGLARAQPVLGASFFIGALALIGIPPLAGFFGKLLVFDTAVRAVLTGGARTGPPFAWLALAVAVVGALLTIVYLSRAWNGAFWGEPTELVANARNQRVLVAVVTTLAVSLVVLGIGFDPVLSAARAGARAALDRTEYVAAVLPEVGP